MIPFRLAIGCASLPLPVAPLYEGLCPLVYEYKPMLQNGQSPIMFRPSVSRDSPTMPSADFCNPVKTDRSDFSESVHTLQTSRGSFQYPLEGCKTQNCRCVNAEFIKRIPVADGRLRGHVPTRLRYVTPHIRFLFIAPQLWIGLPPANTSRY